MSLSRLNLLRYWSTRHPTLATRYAPEIRALETQFAHVIRAGTQPVRPPRCLLERIRPASREAILNGKVI